jgi:hypothetical protein
MEFSHITGQTSEYPIQCLPIMEIGQANSWRLNQPFIDLQTDNLTYYQMLDLPCRLTQYTGNNYRQRRLIVCLFCQQEVATNYNIITPDLVSTLSLIGLGGK